MDSYEAETAPASAQGRNWASDFEWTWRGLKVKKTGAFAPFNRSILTATFNWFVFYFAVEFLRMKDRLARAIASDRGRTPLPRIAFYPERPRPWYLVWAVIALTPLRVTRDMAKADILFQFDDSTLCPFLPPAESSPTARRVNADCLDVSKSRVAQAWTSASGDAFAIDPRLHEGPAVEKSEHNGAHDGRIVQCPMEPLPDRVYQRLVNNVTDEGLVEDLRCPTIGGRPICVFIKERPVTTRFDNDNLRVRLSWPEAQFSRKELEQIQAFSGELGMDWGGVDVLRDRSNGRIYIVDANKTDMGPPTALPLRDKLAATRALAGALARALSETLGRPEKVL